MQFDGWTIGGRNFTDDDGSLPGVELRSLLPRSVQAIFEHFRSRGTLFPEDAVLYDNSLQADVLIDTLTDPAGKVTTGDACAFHCCFSGISHEGVLIPDLGLFVFQDCIAVDYRMGAHWHRTNVNAFFELLAHLKSLAPEAIVVTEKPEGPPFPETFIAALNLYISAP